MWNFKDNDCWVSVLFLQDGKLGPWAVCKTCKLGMQCFDTQLKQQQERLQKARYQALSVSRMVKITKFISSTTKEENTGLTSAKCFARYIHGTYSLYSDVEHGTLKYWCKTMSQVIDPIYLKL